MKCPRCGSEDTRIIEGTYPPTWECKKCGFIFSVPEFANHRF
jgi:uncharacterized Zn finger protein